MLMSTALLAAEQGTEQYSGLHKQLSIMSDIIKSSVTDKSASQVSKINSIESTYLRGQGVVFTISSAANNSQWGNYSFNFSMPEMPVAPIAPEVNHEFLEKFDIDVNETVTRALDSAAEDYERVVEVYEENRDRSRELRDEQREIAYKLREVEREKRDVSYQLSRASEDRKAELKQALAKLNDQEESFRTQQGKIAQLSNKFALEQKEKQKQRAKERSNYYQQLTVSLTQTLCIYGNGLKSLPKNEHVNVILKSAGGKSAGSYKDTILVFTKEDIASCSADKISAETLLNKGQSYQF